MTNIDWMMDLMDDLAHFTRKVGLNETCEAINKTTEVMESEIRDLAYKSRLADIRSRRGPSRKIRDASHLSIVLKNEKPN